MRPSMNVTTRMEPKLDVLSVYFNSAAATLGKVTVKFGRSAPGTSSEPFAASQPFVSYRGEADVT